MELVMAVIFLRRKVVMTIKALFQRILDSASLLRSFIIYLRNHLKVSNNNKCTFFNIHCNGNYITLSGKHEDLSCATTSFLRECVVHMEGNNNSFVINDQSFVYGEGVKTVFVCGNDNRIIVGEDCSLRKVSFFIQGCGNRIVIGDHCSAYAVQFHIEQNENEIYVGSRTTLHGRDEHSIHMAVDEGSKILIGEDCMFSHGIQIRSTDSHSIVDRNGARLNSARNVVIGRHCWIGLQSVILKGTVLEHNCVVGAGAVCSKKYAKSNCVLAGNPAKIVREYVDWDRKFV